MVGTEDNNVDPVRKLNILSGAVRPLSLTVADPDPFPTGVAAPAHSPDHLPHLPEACNPPLSAASVTQLAATHGHCPPGTVVFLQTDQTLVFKVDTGWRYIMVH